MNLRFMTTHLPGYEPPTPEEWRYIAAFVAMMILFFITTGG